jgi:hypothetical protein
MKMIVSLSKPKKPHFISFLLSFAFVICYCTVENVDNLSTFYVDNSFCLENVDKYGYLSTLTVDNFENVSDYYVENVDNLSTFFVDNFWKFDNDTITIKLDGVSLWKMWITYPHFLWISSGSLIVIVSLSDLAAGSVDNVDNLSTFFVDK